MACEPSQMFLIPTVSFNLYRVLCSCVHVAVFRLDINSSLD